MASRLQDVIQRGLRVDQPLATVVAPGTLYYVTDEAVTERSDGASWEDFTDTGGSGGTGDVVGPAGATDSDIVLFDGVTGKLIKDSGVSIAGLLATAGDVFGPAVSVDDRVATFDGITGKLIQDGGKTIATILSDALAAAIAAIIPVDLTTDITGALPAANIVTNMRVRAISLSIDGGGVAITTGIKADVRVPYSCTIQSVTMLADQSGSIVVDIWKDTYANYPPIVGDSITAAAKPTISAALKSEDTTLTGWTTAVAAGDTLRFNVDSAATIQRLALILKVQL